MPAEAKSLNQILAAENYNGDTKLSEILRNELGSMETRSDMKKRSAKFRNGMTARDKRFISRHCTIS